MRVSFLRSRMSSTFHTMHNAPGLCPIETCLSSLVRYDIADTCSACARIEILPVFIQSACVCSPCEECLLCFLYATGRTTISVLTFSSRGLYTYTYRDTESNWEHRAWLAFPFFHEAGCISLAGQGAACFMAQFGLCQLLGDDLDSSRFLINQSGPRARPSPSISLHAAEQHGSTDGSFSLHFSTSNPFFSFNTVRPALCKSSGERKGQDPALVGTRGHLFLTRDGNVQQDGPADKSW